jgi:hypothetical protein
MAYLLAGFLDRGGGRLRDDRLGIGLAVSG